MDYSSALGRLVDHDPRSRNFPAPASTAAHKAVLHAMHGGVLNQGNIGACAGNAGADALNADPLFKTGAKPLVEKDALAIYSAATKLDKFAGSYPPDDTGTDANSVAKALRAMGKAKSWSHAFGLEHVLDALQLKPVMLGINWYEDMFNPNSAGQVHPTGALAGGHETLIRGDDPVAKMVRIRNSWGKSWGVGGDYFLSYADLETLLGESGDALVLAV